MRRGSARSGGLAGPSLRRGYNDPVRWCLLLVLGFGCGGTATLHPGRQHIALRQTPPIPRDARVPEPAAGGRGTAPVRGIRHRDYLLGLFRVGSSPYEIDVRQWSEFFRRGLSAELRKGAVALEPGARLHVEVRSLDVDIPRLAGGVSCTLSVEAILRSASGGRRVFPIEAAGKANSGPACIARASSGAIRHILHAPWLIGATAAPAPVPSPEPAIERGPVERAELLPGTRGRYGTLWSLHLGGGRMRLAGAEGFADQSRTALSFGLTFGIALTRNLFFTSNAYADAALTPEGETAISHGSAGFGAAYYLGGEVLLSAAFMLDLPSKRDNAFEAPGMGFHAMVGKEWQLTSSTWVGGAARPFASWSFENGARILGLVLMTTVAFN